MTFLLNNKVQFQDSASNDAFGRLRVSEPYTLFDSKQIVHGQNLIYDTVISGGSSTYVQTGASTTLTVSGGNNSYVIRQTKPRFNYQTAKSILVLLTGVVPQELNVIKRVGYFDSNTTLPYNQYNGLYFEIGNDGLSVNIAKNGVVRKVLRNDWNIDKMDGTGVFKKTLDMSKSQIFVMDAEWLGVGRVRFGFNIDGLTYYVHEFLNANNIIGVYSQYLNLPIRYEIRSIGGNGSLEQICASVASEGGLDPTGVYRTIKRDSSIAINTGIFRPILAIRLKPDSIVGNVLLENLSILNTSKSDFFYNIKLYSGNNLVNIGGTPTQWDNITFTGLSNSFCEYKTDFDTTYVVNESIDNGVPIIGSFVSTQVSSTISTIKNTLNMGAKINGSRDVFVLEVKSLTANDTYYSSLTWREI